MNEKLAKKIRKVSKRNWRQYLKALKAQPFKVRLGIAWWLVFGDKRRV